MPHRKGLEATPTDERSGDPAYDAARGRHAPAPHRSETRLSVPSAARTPRLSLTPGGPTAPLGREALDPLERGLDTTLGSTRRARSANEALRALSRAARSYTIHDANNAIVRGFIEEMLNAVDGHCATYGDLVLGVTPSELLLDGECVYLERDLERSLAGKLYRDGIRELTIGMEVDWRELVALLGVLTIRFVGVRQFEDDIVTLLGKAGLLHIHVRAVDGVVMADDDEDSDQERQRLPLSFDLPDCETEPRAEVRYQACTLSELAVLRDELEPERNTPQVLDLARRALERWPIVTPAPTRDDVLVSLAQLRDFLVGEGDVVTLGALDQLLAERAVAQPDDASRIDAWRGEHATQAFLERVIGVRDPVSGGAALAQLLSSSPADPLPALLDLLEREPPGKRQQMVAALLQMFARTRAPELAERCRASTGAYAASLLHVLSVGAPDEARALLTTLVRGGDPDVQLEFLALLEQLSRGGDVRAYLTLLLGASDARVQVGALRAIVRLRERGSVGVLAAFAEKRALEGAGREELEEIGAALTTLDPTRALEALRRWCARPGFFARLLRRPRPLAYAAIAGLVRCAAPEAEALLVALAREAEPVLREVAEAALRRRAALPAGELLAPRASLAPPPSEEGSP